MTTIASYAFDEHVELAGFVGDQPVFATVDGLIHFPNGAQASAMAHDGLLCACLSRDGLNVLSGGEDGRVVSTGADGTCTQLAEKPGQWIDAIAAGPQGAVAFAAGRTAWSLSADGEKEFAHERAVEGVAFANKGLRLAVARYNGVTLHWVAGDAKPVDLHWDGAHTGVTYSPDNRYVVTTMAENALHGWRMDEKKSKAGQHMRMSGYPAKPKSLSWSPKGKWLASSGAQSAICWPFSGKDGPMGKAPKELGTRGDTMVVEVACHPTADVVAVGYADGMVMAVSIENGAEHLLRRRGQGTITTLGWHAAGNRLAFGCDSGEAGLIALNG